MKELVLYLPTGVVAIKSESFQTYCANGVPTYFIAADGTKVYPGAFPVIVSEKAKS